MGDFNMALVSKLAWMMSILAPRPWVRVLEARYLKRSVFLQAERTQLASGLWKGLLRARSTIEQGRYFLVGSGSSVRT